MARKRSSIAFGAAFLGLGAFGLLSLLLMMGTIIYGERGLKAGGDPQLLLRARRFYEYLSVRNYGALWELADAPIQRNAKKEDYVKFLNAGLHNVVIVGWSPSKIVRSGSGWAVTESAVTLVRSGAPGSSSKSACERTWWVLRENGWRFAIASGHCGYEINEDEIAILKRPR